MYGNQMDVLPCEENQNSICESNKSQDKQFEESEECKVQNDPQNGEKSVALQTNSESQDVESQETDLKEDLPPPVSQLEHKHRVIVKHSILGNKIPSHDPNVLVESTTFTSMGKIQPFLITISTNAALVLDYHCHLTRSEVVGYLAGSWDVNTHSLSISQALPCKCRLGDYESAPAVEAEIRKTIASNGLSVVGWYHSHPTAPPTPSIRDVEMQLDFELKMKGANDSTYLPCIGFICSPYSLDNTSLESNIVSYWVVPPPENKIHEYGKPMMMSYSVFQDQSISYDVLLEMKKCADFYKPETDYINFSDTIKDSVTFLEKLKMSLTPKFPLNQQKSETLWTYLQDITETSINKSETDVLKQVVEISSVPSAAPLPIPEKPKFNIPSIPSIPSTLSSFNFKSSANPASSMSYHKSQFKTKSSMKRSNSRDSKNLTSLNNYFVGSDLAALFGSTKFPGIGLDPATKSLLNLNSFSLGGMFLPPMAAAAAAAASYKPDPSVGLMKPPPPPPSTSYYPYSSSRSNAGSKNTSASSSRIQNRNIPSTSRDMPPPNKVPKVDAHQMANFFIPTNIGKNCTIPSRSSSSSSSK